MNKNFYNTYHLQNKKNSKIAVISERNFTYRNIIRIVKKYVNNYDEILDVGCGVGSIDFFLAMHKNCSVYGIDISTRSIKLARKRRDKLGLNKVKFSAGSAEEFLKSNRKKFDIVICSEVIEHIENDNAMLIQLSAALKVGGKLLLSTPSKYAPLYRLGLLTDFDSRVGHLRRYTSETLVDMHNTANLKVIEINQVEGIIRNALYTLKPLGWMVRFMKWPISEFVSFLDELTIKLFGESDIYVVSEK